MELGPDGTLWLDGEIRTPNGVVVATLRDSQLFVSPGLGYDVNSDENAIEIVDAYLTPVLQVLKSEGEENLVMNYVSFVHGKDTQTPMAYVCDMTMCGYSNQEEARKRMNSLPRLFRYPGYLHPGARTE
jgi:hypothetical protein